MQIFKSAASDVCEGAHPVYGSWMSLLVIRSLLQALRGGGACLGGYSDVHPRLHRPSDRLAEADSQGDTNHNHPVSESPNRFQFLGNFSRFSTATEAGPGWHWSLSLPQMISSASCLRTAV